MTRRGRFITIEGVEGVGKSTNIDFVQSLLDQHNIAYVSSREPGGTPLAEKIRDLLLDKSHQEMTSITELMLMFSSRVQHVEVLVEPSLKKGTWVVCDRFTDSTYAYQGGGRGVDEGLIKQVDDLALNGYKPDITLLLDLPVEIGLSRAEQRGELDRFESESKTFFENVRNGFLRRAEAEPERFIVVDASQPIEQVQNDIKLAMQGVIQKWLA